MRRCRDLLRVQVMKRDCSMVPYKRLEGRTQAVAVYLGTRRMRNLWTFPSPCLPLTCQNTCEAYPPFISRSSKSLYLKPAMGPTVEKIGMSLSLMRAKHCQMGSTAHSDHDHLFHIIRDVADEDDSAHFTRLFRLGVGEQKVGEEHGYLVRLSPFPRLRDSPRTLPPETPALPFLLFEPRLKVRKRMKHEAFTHCS